MNRNHPETLRRAALQAKAEQLAGFGSWDWEPDTEGLRWSDNLFRIYGLEPGEIEPSPEYLIAHCHPDDRERVQRSVAELARTGRHPDLHYRYVQPDGTVRHLKAAVASVAEADGRSRRMLGAIQDVTDQHQAERELAAHFAVSDALPRWEPGPVGAHGLVRDLAKALDYEHGVMWIPRGDALVAWAIWQAQALHSTERESALRATRVRRNAGLTGCAWTSGAPAQGTDLTDDAADSPRTLTTQALHASLAVPATYGKEVMAMLTFGSRRPTVLTDRFMRSLVGTGYEIGHFLARRRGELSAPALTPRQLEVLQLSATGHANRRIADTLALSEATVRTHFENIFKRLGVHDRASAVGKGLRQGLIR